LGLFDFRRVEAPTVSKKAAGIMPHSANIAPPVCPKCGTEMLNVGKLPQIGLKSLLHVYKCDPCREVQLVRDADVRAPI
jgi:predicted RNA-binding Zn-ribbon protein involved in translation (DUF1610 family)